MRSVGSTRTKGIAAVLGLALLGAAPADAVPAPKPERCLPFNPDPEDGEMIAPDGLSYEQVRGALNRVIQTALKCGQPTGMGEVHLTFDLVVGCNGIVSSISASDDGGAPASYVGCVQSVIKKADFPAHDYGDGFPVTYPVNVSW